MMNKAALFKAATIKWGYDRQLCKLAEEASELSAAASRVINHCGDERSLAEEAADVEIMIEQLRQNGMDGLIDHFKQLKLAQLANRLGISTAEGHCNEQL